MGQPRGADCPAGPGLEPEPARARATRELAARGRERPSSRRTCAPFQPCRAIDARACYAGGRPRPARSLTRRPRRALAGSASAARGPRRDDVKGPRLGRPEAGAASGRAAPPARPSEGGLARLDPPRAGLHRCGGPGLRATDGCSWCSSCTGRRRCTLRTAHAQQILTRLRVAQHVGRMVYVCLKHRGLLPLCLDAAASRLRTGWRKHAGKGQRSRQRNYRGAAS